MAIKKKTMEQIAKENNLDISDANAQRVADAYIQPTLNAITTAEQNAVSSSQTARKALESDYFDQYRNTQYNAQSRGLTGGLANLDTNRLRMQMANANTSITNNLLQKQAELDTQRGTALSNAKQYKTDYLNKILQQVQALREQDYNQRYQEWYAQQQLALQRAQLAQAVAKSKAQADNEALVRDANVQAYYSEQMPDILKKYLRISNKTEANNYLKTVWNNQFKKYGISYNDFLSDINVSAQDYAVIPNKINTISEDNSFWNTVKKSLVPNSFTDYLRQVGGGFLGASYLASPVLGNVTTNIDRWAQYNNAQNQVKDLRKQQEQLQSVLPSWYLSYKLPPQQ